MRTKISKSATGAAEVAELTEIKTEEVSLVDKPANGRQFLVKKRASKSAVVGQTPEGEEVIDLAATEKGAAPGADLDAAEAANVSESDKVIAAKDAADAATYAAEKAKASEGTQPGTIPAVGSGTVETPAVKATIDTSAALASLAAAAALVDGVKKTDITVTPGDDGAVTVSVEDAPAVETAPAAPAAVVDAVKAAVLAGIDAVSARLTTFRTKVEGDNAASPWNMSGRPDIWCDVDYLVSMLYALHDIGGPAWEIEAAGDATEKAAALAKGHKAITGSRVAKFKAVHKGMSYCMKDFSSLMKELDSDAEEEATAVPSDTSKTAAVVAPVTPEIVKAAPALPASVEKDIADLRASVASLNKTVTAQAQQLAKTRDTVQQSNSAPAPEDNKNRGTFTWPADLASPASRIKVQR